MSTAISSTASSEAVFSQSSPLDVEPHGSSETSLLAKRVLPDWVWQVIRQIGCLSKLPQNWDSYGAERPNVESLTKAQWFVFEIAYIVGVSQPHVSAAPSGSAALGWEWDEGRKSLDVEVLADGTLRFAYVDDRDADNDREGTTPNPLEIARLLTHSDALA